MHLIVLKLLLVTSLTVAVIVSGLENLLVIACRGDLRTISLDTGYYAQRPLPVPSTKHAIAVDVDVVEGTVVYITVNTTCSCCVNASPCFFLVVRCVAIGSYFLLHCSVHKTGLNSSYASYVTDSYQSSVSNF